MAAFVETCAYARRAGLLVIADGKRGDIGSTARAYAAAYLEGDEPVADALTVNPWLGRESVEPYLAAARRYGTGIFCVVKTSNAGGDVQDMTLSDGRPVWQAVAALVSEWGAELVGEHGLSAVGAVVGATHPRAVSEARKLMPQTILLLPGVGAQGARPADLARAFTSGPASALVNASRSVIYAFRDTGEDFRAAAGAEAARLRERGMGRLGVVAVPGAALARLRRRRAAVLLAATLAVVLVARRARSDRHAARTPPAAAAHRAAPKPPHRPAHRTYVVRAGDTIEAISARTGVPQSRILALNPKVSPTALFIGERHPPHEARLLAAALAAACCLAATAGAAGPPQRRRPGLARREPDDRRGARRPTTPAYQTPIASITKLMTVHRRAPAPEAHRRRQRRPARRRGRPGVGRTSSRTSGSPSRDLVKAALIQSANDAADALALATARASRRSRR